MSAFISFENVKKTYHMGEIDIHALDDVSFEIQQGEFVFEVISNQSIRSNIICWNIEESLNLSSV